MSENRTHESEMYIRGIERLWLGGVKGMRESWRSVARGAGIAFLGGVLLPCTVAAHAGLTKSNPGSRATLVRALLQ